jgi:hypothetical protein
MKISNILVSILSAVVLTSCASSYKPVIHSLVADNKPQQSIKRSIASSGSLESSAIESVKDFIFTVNDNSGGINVRSNWDKLSNSLKDKATQSAIQSILNDSDKDSFNESLMRVMKISETGQTLVRLPDSPEILEKIEIGEGKTKFSIRPYDIDLIELYEATCTQKEVKGFFGGKSIKYSCQVSGVEFPTLKH